MNRWIVQFDTITKRCCVVSTGLTMREAQWIVLLRNEQNDRFVYFTCGPHYKLVTQTLQELGLK